MLFASKYHGYGNDFLIIASDQLSEQDLSPLTRQICDPHFGIGADGCVFVETPTGPSFPIRIFNRDGSEAEMSGNGVRCAAAFVHHRNLSSEREIHFSTRAGVRVYRLLEERFPVWVYRSAMGAARFHPAEIPVQVMTELESIVDFDLPLKSGSVRINAVNVGNPQCVVIRSSPPSEEEFLQMGSQLATHEAFPQGTNVSFVWVEGSHRLEIRIWERGVGPTHSSGTGCCGAAVAALRAGLVASPVKVITATGTQIVEWQEGQEIFLTGEAEFIAELHYHWKQD